MQLRMARVCLDCEEVHDAQTCPVCASESFAFLTRWVPAPERRKHPRPATSPEAETYKQLMNQEVSNSPARSWVTRGALGLTMLGLAGWIWSRAGGAGTAERSS
jgi:hypothetical protein